MLKYSRRRIGTFAARITLLSLIAFLLTGAALPANPAAAQADQNDAIPITASNVDRLVPLGARGMGALKTITWGGSLILAQSEQIEALFDLDQPEAPHRILGDMAKGKVLDVLRDDGTLVRSTDGSLALEIRDGKTDAIQRMLSLDDPTIKSTFDTLTISDDGNYAFVAYRNGAGAFWDLRMEKQLWKRPNMVISVYRVLDTPPLVVLKPNPSEFIVIDGLTGKTIKDLKLPPGNYYDSVFASADKSTLVAVAGFNLDVLALKTGILQRVKAAKDGAGSPGQYVDNLYAVTVSPNGAVLAVLTFGSKLQLWDTKTGTKLPAPPYGAQPGSAIGFNHAGDRLRYGGSADFELTEWDWAAKTERSIAIDSTPISIEDGWIVTVNRETVALLDDKGATVQSFSVPGGDLLSASVSPDGSRLATYAYGQLRIFDVASGKQTLAVRRFYNNDAMNFAPGGYSMIVGSTYTRYLYQIDARTGEIVRSLLPVAPTRSAQASSFDYQVSPDGKQALISVNRTTEAARTTEYYSADLTNASAPLQLLSTLPYIASMRAAAWGQGSSIYALVTDGCCIKRLDATKGKESKQIALTSMTTWVATPDLKRLYSATVQNGQMTLVAWDLATGESIATIGTQKSRLASDQTAEVAISRDGTRLTTAFGQLVTLWDARALNQVKVLVQDKAISRVPTRGGSVNFDKTGQYVIKYTGYAEVNLPHSVTWWEANTGKQIAQVYYSPKAIGSSGGADITVSPRSDTLTILDRTVEVVAIYDAPTGKLIYSAPPPVTAKSASSPASSPIQAITYDPSGSMIVLANKDGQLSIRDAQTGKELRQLMFAPQGYFRHVDFTGDGTVLVADYGQEAFVVR